MAIITAFDGPVRFDLTDLQPIADGVITSISSSQIIVINAQFGETYIFDGSFSNFDPVTGRPGAGTATGYQLLVNGRTFVTITGLSIPAVDVVNYILTDNVLGLQQAVLAGNDLILGSSVDQAGIDDILYGGAGNDIIQAFAGDDSLFGDAGQDDLSGQAGNDDLHGGSEDDVLNGGLGNDTLDGGTGFDIASYVGATAGVTVDLTVVGSQDTGSTGRDTLISIEGLVGSSHDDILIGSNGDNTLTGGDGNDVLLGLGGINVLAGSDGEDAVSYIGATSGVTVSLSIVSAQSTGVSIDTLFTVEDLYGSRFNDTLTGDAGPNILLGDQGNDTLKGLAGNDILDGGSGADQLTGGTGNDTYFVDTQADLVFENASEGNDAVIASTGFYLYPNIEILSLASGAGSIFGVGNELANVIVGNEGDNLLIAADGDDSVSGGAGNDSLFGQNGDDSLSGGAGVDYLVGGIGNDTLDGGDGPDALYGEDGADSLNAGPGFFTDILVGGNGDDVLTGASGFGDYDLMDGGAGNDLYLVDTPADLTFEAVGGGTDTVFANIVGAGYYLYANVENLTLQGQTPYGVGNELDNILTGNAIGNWLLGGAGNDTLNGKQGNDVLFGEAGSDTFVFERGTGGDVIGDFQVGVDKIELLGLGLTTFADVQARMIENGGTTAIDIGQGELIVVNGVGMSAFTASDFIFAATAQVQPGNQVWSEEDSIGLIGAHPPSPVLFI